MFLTIPTRQRPSLRGRLATLLAAIALAAWGLVGLAAPAHAHPSQAITAVSPTSGPTSGGTSVEITGFGFEGGNCNQVGSVSFGSSPASFTINSDTSITATAPAHAAGTVHITLVDLFEDCFSDATPADEYTYVDDTPPGCTITGTSGDDTLTGTNGDDTICGLGGNDTISGGNGNDTIYPGPGNDTANGNNGTDTIIDHSGTDTLNGDNGDDSLDVQDTVAGDTADGGNGNDTCATDAGDTSISC
ncbi:calcium-binding protein [Streptomyces sp. NPDC059002]|uniref:calcium-binding protein n=1 Tax=Streptomyces sp. NPDC059002 TaxID=3346690 RepID=UPI00368A636E